MNDFLVVDLPALIALILALIACGTLGNWLVLRRESLAADATAHAVLPGLVGGYLATGTRSPWAMLVGAAFAGLAAILLARFVARTTRTGAAVALGIVFTAFFALGVALLETRGARQVDLDPSCVLFGSLETLFVAPHASETHPSSWSSAWAWITALPRPVWTLALAAVLAVLTSTLLAKELAMRAFDASFVRVSGAAPRWTDDVRIVATTFAIVAAFEAVGSVLVIAIVACPALTAAPFARSVRGQIIGSLAIASPLAIAAYMAAAHAPIWLGTAQPLNAAGTVACAFAAAVPLAHFAYRLFRRDGRSRATFNRHQA
jgi:manganese/zinc/iron transport system permease protein